MSAKELGMIHTVNIDKTNISSATSNTHAGEFDLSTELTRQLQKMVRQGNYFKVVGIDISMDVSHLPAGQGNAGRVIGELQYYTPTRGRCNAYRHAFKAMAEQMSNQGVPMRENKLYDFKVGLTSDSPNNPDNQATLDGTNGLYLDNNAVPGASVFGVYNDSVQPAFRSTGLPNEQFATGFDTLLQSGGSKTDFVLNDTVVFTGNEDFANLQRESIPFQIGFGDDDTTATFQFRPEPALYIAVMNGLFSIFIHQAFTPDTDPNFGLNISVMVAGWKSIMSEPATKKRSKRKGRK